MQDLVGRQSLLSQRMEGMTKEALGRFAAADLVRKKNEVFVEYLVEHQGIVLGGQAALELDLRETLAVRQKPLLQSLLRDKPHRGGGIFVTDSALQTGMEEISHLAAKFIE